MWRSYSRTELAYSQDALVAAQVKRTLAHAELQLAQGAYEEAAREVVRSAVTVSQAAPHLRAVSYDDAADLGMELALMGDGIYELGADGQALIQVAHARVDEVLLR